MLLLTTCKPSTTCARCRAGFRRTYETHIETGRQHVHKFTHHIEGHQFEDCADQKYERVTFGAYENRVPVAPTNARPARR